MAALAVPDIGYKATLGESIRRAGRLFGDRDFIVLPDRRLTLAAADRASGAVAKRMLAAGIGKRTRIGLFYTRGANVSPCDVELVLEGLRDIAHALVFGMPHPELEEEVTAVVVPAPGASPSAESIRSRARQVGSSYQVPTRIDIVSDEAAIPWLASGKPDKLALRARLGSPA